jgi:adenosylhomocysteine nucleosidase
LSHSIKSLGIIAAVEAEVADILADQYYAWGKKGTIYVSKKFPLRLIVSHIGKANAAFALGRIIDDVSHVLMMGTSGGLGNEKVGSMYLSTEFVEHDMDATGLGTPAGVTPFSDMKTFVITPTSVEYSAEVVAAAKQAGLDLSLGRTMSGDQFINDRAVAEAKRERFGVQLVDMESAAVAKICVRYGRPMLAVRYITDNADHEAHLSWQENVKISSGLMDSILKHLL